MDDDINNTGDTVTTSDGHSEQWVSSKRVQQHIANVYPLCAYSRTHIARCVFARWERIFSPSLGDALPIFQLSLHTEGDSVSTRCWDNVA